MWGRPTLRLGAEETLEETALRREPEDEKRQPALCGEGAHSQTRGL